MNDQLLAMSPQDFQYVYKEVELKLEKLQNKNNVIQQNVDVEVINRELYQMIRLEIDHLNLFIQEIKDQMKSLENYCNNIDQKNKIKRLKDSYLKETQRTKAIISILNNKSAFKIEKQYEEVNIKSQSDTGGLPDSQHQNQYVDQQLIYQKIKEVDQYQKGTTVQNQDSPSNSISQDLQIQNDTTKGIIIEDDQKRDEEIEVQEEINNQVYLIVLVIVIIIAVLIIWLLYVQDIL